MHTSAVIDVENSTIKLGLAQEISSALGARDPTIEDLKADSIVDAARSSASFDIQFLSGVFPL